MQPLSVSTYPEQESCVKCKLVLHQYFFSGEVQFLQKVCFFVPVSTADDTFCIYSNIKVHHKTQNENLLETTCAA